MKDGNRGEPIAPSRREHAPKVNHPTPNRVDPLSPSPAVDPKSDSRKR